MQSESSALFAAAVAAIAASLLAGCHQESQNVPPPITSAQQAEIKAKEAAHLTPDQQGAIKSQAAADSNVRPEH